MSDDDQVKKLLEAGASVGSAELLEMISSDCSLDDAKARIAERDRIRLKADKLLNLPPDQWPEFDVQWDLRPESFHWAMDSVKAGQINPADYGTMWTSVSEIDRVLHHYSQRAPDELWTLGSPGKLARVIVHCVERGQLTPTFVIKSQEQGKLLLGGGNHRLAVCRAKGVGRLPILFKVSEEDHIKNLLTR